MRLTQTHPHTTAIHPAALPLTVAALLTFASADAGASCGSAYCTLLNDRYALGTWDHVGWSADVRLESVTQDRLRSGTKTISASDVTDEDAIERRTRNLTLATTLERSFDEHWSLALRVPVLRRDHLHDPIDPQTGAVGPDERWTYTQVGDVQVLGRYQQAAAEGGLGWAVLTGLKLPTGRHGVTNDDGLPAERALQPGSGTTDLVLGASLRWMLGGADALNLQLTHTAALNQRDDFKPGARTELSVGWSHALSPSWSGVVQLNLANRGRDRGDQAEPDNSGSTTLSLTPGLSVALGAQDTAYAFVQCPVYQRVNGIQLVPRAAFALGWTRTF